MVNGLKNVKIKPMKVNAGDRIQTSLEYSGNLKNGFFDNAIINCNNDIVDWNPDPHTFDRSKYSGVLHDEVNIKSNWNYFIPEWILPGKCIISVRVYDDIDGTVKTRKIIERQDINITVNQSKSDIITFLFITYNNLFDRNPDQNGLKTWYNALQIQGVPKSVVIENGFLNSHEYRLRYFYKFINIDEGINQKLYNEWYDELIRYGASDKKPYNLMFNDIKFKSKNLSNKEYCDKIINSFIKIDDTSMTLINNLCKERINKIDITLNILDNFRLKKLIIFNKIYSPIISENNTLKELMNYIDNLVTFDDLWNKYYIK